MLTIVVLMLVYRAGVSVSANQPKLPGFDRLNIDGHGEVRITLLN